jgi:hypothetical protein
MIQREGPNRRVREVKDERGRRGIVERGLGGDWGTLPRLGGGIEARITM